MFLRSARLSSIVVFALSTLLVTSLAAQQPKVLAPHKPVPLEFLRSNEDLCRPPSQGQWSADFG
jgi:hypothetical protein